MFNTYDSAGLGVGLDLSAGTFDANGNAKTAFAVGETILFRVWGEPMTGVLVGWYRDNILISDIGWEGVSTNGEGFAQWSASSFPAGKYVYTILVPINGVSPDPKKVLNFTVGGSTSTTTTATTPTNTGREVTTTKETQTPRCAPGYVYDTLLGCYIPGALTNQQTQNQYAVSNQAANACTPFGLEMSADGRCIIPRTTTERWTDPTNQVEVDAKAAQDAREARDAVAALVKQVQDAQKALLDAQAAQKSAAELAALQAKLDAANLALAGSGSGGAASDFTLPSWLQGDWFGLPKPLVIGLIAAGVFIFKK